MLPAMLFHPIESETWLHFALVAVAVGVIAFRWQRHCDHSHTSAETSLVPAQNHETPSNPTSSPGTMDVPPPYLPFWSVVAACFVHGVAMPLLALSTLATTAVTWGGVRYHRGPSGRINRLQRSENFPPAPCMSKTDSCCQFDAYDEGCEHSVACSMAHAIQRHPFGPRETLYGLSSGKP
jgi:hypothetical protein